MRVVEIRVAGNVRPGQTVPEVFVSMSRTGGSENIKVTFMSSDGQEEHLARGDNRMEVWQMAQRIQMRVDGYLGTGTDIRWYADLLEYFVD